MKRISLATSGLWRTVMIVTTAAMMLVAMTGSAAAGYVPAPISTTLKPIDASYTGAYGYVFGKVTPTVYRYTYDVTAPWEVKTMPVGSLGIVYSWAPGWHWMQFLGSTDWYAVQTKNIQQWSRASAQSGVTDSEKCAALTGTVFTAAAKVANVAVYKRPTATSPSVGTLPLDKLVNVLCGKSYPGAGADALVTNGIYYVYVSYTNSTGTKVYGYVRTTSLK